MAREAKKAPDGNSHGGSGWAAWRCWRAGRGVGTGGAQGASAIVTHDPQFTLSRDHDSDALTVDGLAYASRAKVQRVFAQDFDRSVFAVPLDERRRRLLAVDWVEDASVSRIWPDRLVVRIRERKPVAFVPVRLGRCC